MRARAGRIAALVASVAVVPLLLGAAPLVATPIAASPAAVAAPAVAAPVAARPAPVAVSPAAVPAPAVNQPGSEISLSRQAARPGERVAVNGSAFADCVPVGAPGTRVTLAWRPVAAVPGAYARLGTALVDGRGVFAGSFAVPRAATPGTYQVSASCARRQGVGRDTVEDTANLRVVDPAAALAEAAGPEGVPPAEREPGWLAVLDRAPVVPVVGASAAGLLIGLVLWLARRRRQRRPREVTVDAVPRPVVVPEPRLRQVGIGRTVALRVEPERVLGDEAGVEHGPLEVRWIREGNRG